MEFHIIQLQLYIIIFQDSNITHIQERAVDALMELFEFQKAGNASPDATICRCKAL
jgi:hypothetical protein